jgi:hypothetical protein
MQRFHLFCHSTQPSTLLLAIGSLLKSSRIFAADDKSTRNHVFKTVHGWWSDSASGPICGILSTIFFYIFSMWDITLTSAFTTKSPSLVNLFTLTKLPLACKSFSTFQECLTPRIAERDTTLNPTHLDTYPRKVTMALIPIIVIVHNNDE